jgi:two-component system, OmpR family, copper resistance phosphate regulon response regulator CusR
MRILLVEDEPNAARMLAKGLREQSYAVDIAADGEAALYQLNIYDYDLMVLDVMLPHKDGLQVCRELRGLGLSTPVLMLTARDAVDDRIAGLDAGADDYLIKPFDFGELLARARALLRRGDTVQSEILRVADLEINTRSRTVKRGTSNIQLSAKEYALVEYFARNAGRVLGRADIAEHVWDKNFDIFSNLIEVYVQHLRRKIDDGHAVKLFHTRRGEGYALTADEDQNV